MKTELNYKGLRFRVCLVRESGQEEKIVLKNSDEVYELVKEELLRADREMMLSVMLTVKNDLIGVQTIGIGSLDSLTITPREVFKSAILSNAAKFVLCHNHPSGNRNPSAEDINITQKMIQAAEIIGIDLLDHIIVGHDGYTTLRSHVNFP